MTQTRTWFRRHALPILRAREGPERRSLGTTQHREKCITLRLKESSPFLYARKMEDEHQESLVTSAITMGVTSNLSHNYDRYKFVHQLHLVYHFIAYYI